MRLDSFNCNAEMCDTSPMEHETELTKKQLSSASRRIPQTSIHLRQRLPSSARTQQWQITAAGIHGVRHASSWWPFGGSKKEPAPIESTLSSTTDTSESSAAAAASTSSPPTEIPTPPVAEATNPPTDLNIDTITIDPVAEPLVPPDTIGYLHSLGLDFGWGPTSTMQWIIEHIHVYTGLPWWGSIAAASVLLRIALIRFYIKSSDMSARQLAMSPVTKPLSDKMQAANKAGDRVAAMQAYKEFKDVRKRAGLSIPAQFMPMILQGIFGYGGYKLLSRAAELPVPEFKTGGFLWLTDLTVPDPYLLMPLAMGGMIHFLVRIGGESGAAQTDAMGQQMRKFMLYGTPAIICLVTGFQSGAVVTWFAAGGLLGVGQSLLLRNPGVRDALGIAQMYQQPKGQASTTPFQERVEGMMERWQSRGKPQALDVKGTAKRTETLATQGRGKNEEYMRPTYQQPNLRFSSPVVEDEPVVATPVAQTQAEGRMEGEADVRVESAVEETPVQTPPAVEQQKQAQRSFAEWQQQQREQREKMRREKARDTPVKKSQKGQKGQKKR